MSNQKERFSPEKQAISKSKPKPENIKEKKVDFKKDDENKNDSNKEHTETAAINSNKKPEAKVGQKSQIKEFESKVLKKVDNRNDTSSNTKTEPKNEPKIEPKIGNPGSRKQEEKASLNAPTAEDESELAECEIDDVEVIEYESGQLQIRKSGQKIPYREWKVIRGLLVTFCMLALTCIAIGGLIAMSFELEKNSKAAMENKETMENIEEGK